MTEHPLADRIVGPPVGGGLCDGDHRDAYYALVEIEDKLDWLFKACMAAELPVGAESTLDKVADILQIPGPRAAAERRANLLADEVRLRGPVAYLGKDTTEPAKRRIESLTWRDLPLTLAYIKNSPVPVGDDLEVVGTVTSLSETDGVVWAEAHVWEDKLDGIADPAMVGTRFGVGIDVASAFVVYVDRDGNEIELKDLIKHDMADLTQVFTEARMMGVTINHNPAWSAAYLEVIGPDDAP